jgi:hypothetical protein
MSVIKDIKESFSKYIVSPISRFGLGGFVFDIVGDQSSSQQAQITDHYTEDNTATQDHIAISPERIILKSSVGELVHFPQEDALSTVQDLAQKLTTIDFFLTTLSDAETQFRQDNNEADFIDIESDTYDDLLNLWDLTVQLSPGQSRQQRAYLYFKALFEKRILVAVLTPFGFKKSMAIESIEAIQREESLTVSDFTITLKEIRTTSLELTPFKKEDHQGRNLQQQSPQVNHGSSGGVEVPTTTLRNLYESITGKKLED